jgi:hypothetical protein
MVSIFYAPNPISSWNNTCYSFWHKNNERNFIAKNGGNHLTNDQELERLSKRDLCVYEDWWTSTQPRGPTLYKSPVNTIKAIKRTGRSTIESGLITQSLESLGPLHTTIINTLLPQNVVKLVDKPMNTTKTPWFRLFQLSKEQIGSRYSEKKNSCCNTIFLVSIVGVQTRGMTT